MAALPKRISGLTRRGGASSTPSVRIRLPSVAPIGIEFKDFAFPDLYTVGEGDPEKEYYRQPGVLRTSVHWGQLKLLMTELDFIIRYWDPVAIPHPIFVYVGAAPGHHLVALTKLFPDITFELYDKQAFSPHIQNLPTVHLHQAYFLESDALMWKEQQAQNHNVFFISDIRTLTHKRGMNLTQEEQTENERLVASDMKLQREWVETIVPVEAHLKFRLPYSYDFIPLHEYEYLDGTVYRQAWAGQTSTECRLVPAREPNSSSYKKRLWNYKSHENMMFYHNNEIRQTFKFKNPISGLGEENPRGLQLGLTSDYDSSLTLLILKGYFEKYRNLPSLENLYDLFQFLDSAAFPPKTLALFRSGQFQGAQDLEDAE